MTDRYEKIRKALEMGPTPGPWELTELPRDIQRDGYKFAISRNGLGWWIAKVTHEANGGTGVANATYIAAADPDTVTALLRDNDKLRAALAEAAERLAAVGYPVNQAGEYSKSGEWDFSEAVPRAVDAAEVKAAFLVIRAALADGEATNAG